MQLKELRGKEKIEGKIKGKQWVLTVFTKGLCRANSSHNLLLNEAEGPDKAF